MKLALEREISDLDQEIRLRKSEAKKIGRLEEKVKAQRAIKEMERKRIEKRQNLLMLKMKSMKKRATFKPY